jgi:hypothetical protein
MSTLLNIIREVTLDALRNIAYFIKNNLINLANVLNFILPFGMYFIGQHNKTIGWEICIPLVCALVIYYIRSTANKLGKGITIPVPDERFTEVDDDGEVSIKHDRVQELLLYTADLEDWLERKGLL